MATASRVLPWRRHQETVTEELAPLLAVYRARHPRGSSGLIQAAYEAARRGHATQHRTSGELYINHPIAVARIVAELGLDDVSIAAALLHDAVEDTEITLADVEANFGGEVAGIVDGVTKLERIRFDSREEQQAATMRKMLVAMARDLRVLVIKLADRLHNMRTVAARPLESQRRIAQETLDIYAPLAHRLGMQEIKQHLEDLAFAALYPKRYAELDHLVYVRAPQRNVYLAKALAQVQRWLDDAGIEGEITARGKHLWSIYEKMMEKNREFEDIFDLMAIRIVVDTEADCYSALGILHSHWKPVVGRFKDYIAMPKFNFYQSLHTTVVGPDGKAIEVQIRTGDMHRRAEWGVAAHWSYKDGDGRGDIDWLNRIMAWQGDVSDPRQFMETLKRDLEQDELFVFTPKGRVITLPPRGTPVDFAYEVHTDVGHGCVGARVNGRLVPLSARLQSGDTCEILLAPSGEGEPSEEWLEFVVSPKARSKVRQWLARERRDDLVEAGREELVERIGEAGLDAEAVLRTDIVVREAQRMNYASADTFFGAIGEGTVDAASVAVRIVEAARESGDGAMAEPPPASGPTRPPVTIEGLRGAGATLARCCTPVPGDEIVGVASGARTVTVHRADCALAVPSGGGARMVEVEWSDERADAVFVVAVEVVALDRSRLLRDVANALSDQHVNIVACSTQTGTDRVARMRFEFEMADPSHLRSVLRVIKRIEGVYDAHRVLQVATSSV
ncbi:MAG: RelA/SpoT family protein [Acidimicrobiia bacterium]